MLAQAREPSTIRATEEEEEGGGGAAALEAAASRYSYQVIRTLQLM